MVEYSSARHGMKALNYLTPFREPEGRAALRSWRPQWLVVFTQSRKIVCLGLYGFKWIVRIKIAFRGYCCPRLLAGDSETYVDGRRALAL